MEQNTAPAEVLPAVVEKKTPKPIEANEKGELIGSTFEDQYRLAKAYFSSGLMPQGLNSPEKVMVAVQLCRELGLPPMTSISKIAVINGTASLFGDLPLALVYRSGKIECIEERWTTDPATHQTTGAQCVVKRKGMTDSVVRTFTLKDAEKAGLTARGPWKQYPARMLQMRARSWALKDAFADVLMGASIAEYDHNATMDSKGNVVGVEAKTVVDELNETYAKEEANPEQDGPQ